MNPNTPQTKPSVLLVHNYYRQAGGEDVLFHTEKEILESAGHPVSIYERHNRREINSRQFRENVDLFRRTIWARDSYDSIQQLILQHKPQIVHIYNSFPLISPAAYHASRDLSIPVVQSLQNYRLLCPNAQFYRSGRVCEDCLGKAIPWPGVLHACYRHSRSASAAVASMLVFHRLKQTWSKTVTMYIVPTNFARQKFIQGGLPAEKIVVKPNCVYPDPGPGAREREFFLFVGRLTKEKGVMTLLSAWKRLGTQLPLKIVGDGPLAAAVAARADDHRQIDWLGRLSKEEMLSVLKRARGLIVPSEWYEGFPMIIVQAFAMGVPVIASSLGGPGDAVVDGYNGFLIPPSDPAALAEKVNQMASGNSDEGQLRLNARQDFEAKYTAEQNYKLLMAIYQRILQEQEI